MRNLLGLVLLVGVFLLAGCTISHTYGPYMGKVVEKGTGEPIEGAVVFIRFYTQTGNLGGSTSHFADAVEVLTGKDGEFEIPAQTVEDFRILAGWEQDGIVIVFKPGYGVYPGHKNSSIDHSSNWGLPKNKPVTIALPKLTTMEEIKKNLRFAEGYDIGIPCEKHKDIKRLTNFESIGLGLEPQKCKAE